MGCFLRLNLLCPSEVSMIMLTAIPKQKTERNKKYLAFIRTKPCCICGWIPSESYGYLIHAHHTESGGISCKGADKSAVPLCFACHRKVHDSGRKDAIPKLQEIIDRLQKEWREKS